MKNGGYSLSYGLKYCRKSGSTSGFTIVELLIVIVIIGILAAITIISYTGISSRATIASLQSDLTDAANQLKLDQVTGNSYPATLALANGGKGIPASAGTTYTYAVSNVTTPPIFCLSAINGSYSYNVTQDGQLLANVCPILNLDASNLTSYQGTGTTWTDLSGNGNNGTLVNGVLHTNTNGGAMNFDGVDDYVSLPIGVPAGRSFTIEVIGKVSSTAVSNNFVSANPPAFIRIVGGHVRWDIYIKKDSDGTYAWSFNNGNINILSNTVYDLTMTYDGTWLKGYVNGSLDINIAYAGQVMGSSSLIVGYTTGGEDSPLGGDVYLVKVYNKTLLDADVNQNFNAHRSRYGI